MASGKTAQKIKEDATVLLNELMSLLCKEEISKERFRYILITVEHALARQRMQGAQKVLETMQVCVGEIERILNGG